MPRWPAGLHRASGSGTAYGYRPIRPQVTPQQHYWRETASELHAGGTGVFTRNNVLFQISQFNAFAGPQSVGERWQVTQVQVQAGSQYGQSPLVIQQQSAQSQALNSAQPPPIVAQVWRQIGGVNIYLLAQSSNGGNDNLAISCPLLSAGEGIGVVWYGGIPLAAGTWFQLTGTRYTLGPE